MRESASSAAMPGREVADIARLSAPATIACDSLNRSVTRLLYPRPMLSRAFLLVCLLVLPLLPVHAAAPDGKPAGAGPAETGADSGLPVPRFVSLASDKVNARTGPGSRYPIAWQYQRRNLPVEVVAEYEYWRRVRDHDGTEAWVHKNLTSGKRYALVDGIVRPLLAKTDPAAEVLLTAEPGVQVRLRRCPNTAWCQVEIAGKKGWMERRHLWGLYPHEIFD
jgi:SH3-like domain-containing protein